MTLDGPYTIFQRDSGGALTSTQAPGIHMICSPEAYAAHADVLAAYLDADQTKLQAVYEGDIPAAPTMTVALTFADQATLDAAKAALSLA